MDLSGRQTQFYIDLVYGAVLALGFGHLLFVGLDARVAAFQGGLVLGYFLRVWENMSIYERVLQEEVAAEAEAAVAERVPDEAQEQVASEVEERVPEKVEEHVPEKVEEHVPEKVEEHVPEKVEEHVSDEVEERVSDEVEERVSEEVDERVTDEVGAELVDRLREIDAELAEEHQKRHASDDS